MHDKERIPAGLVALVICAVIIGVEILAPGYAPLTIIGSAVVGSIAVTV